VLDMEAREPKPWGVAEEAVVKLDGMKPLDREARDAKPWEW
jgi:hypothetical protein